MAVSYTHLDVYKRQKLSHACVLRRCHELVGDGHIHQFCIRSGERAEFEFAAQHTEMHKFDFTGLAELTEQLCACLLYTSPGWGCPAGST